MTPDDQRKFRWSQLLASRMETDPACRRHGVDHRDFTWWIFEPGIVGDEWQINFFNPATKWTRMVSGESLSAAIDALMSEIHDALATKEHP